MRELGHRRALEAVDHVVPEEEPDGVQDAGLELVYGRVWKLSARLRKKISLMPPGLLGREEEEGDVRGNEQLELRRLCAAQVPLCVDVFCKHVVGDFPELGDVGVDGLGEAVVPGLHCWDPYLLAA